MKHPLEPLTKEEIEKASHIFKTSRCVGEDVCIFSNVQLIEPSKEELGAFENGQQLTCPPRIARLVGTRPIFSGGGFSALVNLTEENLISHCALPANEQAPYSEYDIEQCCVIVRKDPEFIASMIKRGIAGEKIDNVEIDPWPGGGFLHPSMPKGHRGMRAILFYREQANDNIYARPIQNVIVHVDMTDEKVVAIEDHGIFPFPPAKWNSDHFDDERLPPPRTSLKPLEIIQPEGPSFTVDGHHVKWENWDFRVSVHPIHGIVLHDVSFHQRSVLFRAALGDMTVPYGDPDPMHNWKQVLDASEYNVGTLVNSLELGCDCLGHIKYFDANQIKPDGTCRTVKNAICMHEEDFGIQFKHTGERTTGISMTRRSRRLVLSSFVTVYNYDYGFYWYLYLDGVIEVEVKLTGIVGVTSVIKETVDQSFAPLISENIASPLHQHLFNFRIDWNLDGGKCSLYEDQVESVPLGAKNPNGNLFQLTSKLLSTEEEAKRIVNPANSRTWKVVNPLKKNALGNPVSYKVHPGPAPQMLAHPDSIVAKRNTFGQYNLWATPFTPDELTSAGDYPVNSEGNSGLLKYTKANRNIVNCDLVTWHTIGVNHVPRPEDWPIMPCEYVKLSLQPSGFFDHNPCLDLPAKSSKMHKECH